MWGNKFSIKKMFVLNVIWYFIYKHMDIWVRKTGLDSLRVKKECICLEISNGHQRFFSSAAFYWLFGIEKQEPPISHTQVVSQGQKSQELCIRTVRRKKQNILQTKWQKLFHCACTIQTMSIVIRSLFEETASIPFHFMFGLGGNGQTGIDRNSAEANKSVHIAGRLLFSLRFQRFSDGHTGWHLSLPLVRS